ncbi:beta-ketoacyl synthase chain length factor [Arenibacter sp. F26102]|uniref:beta-ketoacyl synthase N-terminal-like domain-containing protein n=1 Tax=Arenibacter sp. F26102 TaxID=2926416 RepID=UPI001FF6D11B|nr:beta-ketoacyl synthase N-terminal-like domain-containing protein [Arenibacter sp. F26102]MCK0145103.1 beta-ketoacyl synthase chain length factor [Arenibacter sp. F26102]
MEKVFINSIGSISAQKTFDNNDFLEEITTYEDNVISAIEPNYKDFIPPAAARRMAKGIKMGVVAAKIAIEEANLTNVDAIITGTGMGCVRDSEKFVTAILDNQEQFLTPTSFIQSTHNTVAGQIALGIGCKGYNFTYVHSSVSFESALLDALMQLQTKEAENILIGGVDESGEHTNAIHKLIHHIKPEKINSNKLLQSNTEGAVFGEGANFFVLSNNKQNSSYAQILGVKTFNTLPQSELATNLEEFLKNNNLSVDDIDVLISGNNGDLNFDNYYLELSKGLFKNTQQVYYKHLSGEFNTASSFGFWVGAKILKSQHIPSEITLNTIKSKGFGTVLLYNQYRGKNHSFTLLRQC